MLGAEIEGWATERVRDVLRSRHYFHAMHFPRAFHMHPLNYALGLAAAAEQAGARIFEGTPALSIDPDGVRKRIATPHGRVRASHIVLACNVHLGALMPRAAGTLLPIWSYMFVTAPLGPRLLEAIRYRGAVSDTDLADNHYRIVDGDRLLFSGRSTTWEADPRRYVDKLKADLAEIYPRIGNVEVEYVWSGVLGSALHRMPQLGELTPGFWMASGFGGHGLNTTAMAGNILARAIVDGDDTWRLFSPYEFVWAGGKLGRAVKQVFYWVDHAPRALRGAPGARARGGGRTRQRPRTAICRRAVGEDRARYRAGLRSAGGAGAGFVARRPRIGGTLGDGGRSRRRAAGRAKPSSPGGASRRWRISTRRGRRDGHRRRAMATRPNPTAAARLPPRGRRSSRDG